MANSFRPPVFGRSMRVGVQDDRRRSAPPDSDAQELKLLRCRECRSPCPFKAAAGSRIEFKCRRCGTVTYLEVY